MKALTILCAIMLCACRVTAFAQDGVRGEILALYSFSPHTLSKEAQSEKSAALDAFWEKAKGQRKTYIPVLQELLRKTNAPPFFLFDGSRLLLDLSDTAENRQLAVEALARCDLRDVDRTVYLEQVHSLAMTGVDTTDAAFHILDDPTFKAFIPQHALTLGQDFCLILTLFPADSTHWLQRAIKRLETGPDPEAQKSLAYLLWYAQLNESDLPLQASRKRQTNQPPAATSPGSSRRAMGNCWLKLRPALRHRRYARARLLSAKHVSER